MLMNERYHDFSYGHRVCGHENKCKHLHGHNGRVTFTCLGPPDSLGRIIDFGVMKSTLCQWLEDNWDHKMLLWKDDPMIAVLLDIGSASDACNDTEAYAQAALDIVESIALVPFNPTAENMAHYLLNTVGPAVLEGTGVTVWAVKVEETRKCSATAVNSTGTAYNLRG